MSIATAPQQTEFPPVQHNQGAHDQGVAYDADAFNQIEQGFDASYPVDSVEAAAASGDIVALRKAIGATLLSVGEKIGDEVLVADAQRFDEATESFVKPDTRAEQQMRIDQVWYSIFDDEERAKAGKTSTRNN